MFEKAARLKLRFDSHIGQLTAEDLWEMSLQSLNVTAKILNKEIKTHEEEDFLEASNKELVVVKLKFNIVLHIIKTRKDENKAESEARSRKEAKQKILAIIDKKRDGALEEKSEKELLEELDKLG